MQPLPVKSADESPVTHVELRFALKTNDDRIFKAMSEEFSQISAHMLTKEDATNFATKNDVNEIKDILKNHINELKGLIVDRLTKLQSQEGEHTVSVFQQQRTSDQVEYHETCIKKVEKHLGFV